MVLTDSAFDYILSIQSKVRAAIGKSQCEHVFTYDGEDFFERYEALRTFWCTSESQRNVSNHLKIGRSSLKQWEQLFIDHGAIGLLPDLDFITVDPRLEQLSLLVKEARQHEQASHTLQLAEALRIPNSSLDIIRRIQRSHGFGQRQDDNDRQFYKLIQMIFGNYSGDLDQCLRVARIEIVET
jgi:hypothetical protein